MRYERKKLKSKKIVVSAVLEIIETIQDDDLKASLRSQIEALSRAKKNKKNKGPRPIDSSEAPTIDKINYMVNVCKNPKEQMIILAMWNLGLRAKELTGLIVGEIDLRGEQRKVHITVENGKGDYSERHVPIQAPEYYEHLRDYIEERDLRPIDPLIAKGSQKAHYTKRHIMRICKKIGERAGMPWFRSHMLRHSRARWMLEKGAIPETVQKFLGHGDVYTTLKYYGTFRDKEHIKHVMELPKIPWVYDRK